MLYEAMGNPIDIKRAINHYLTLNTRLETLVIQRANHSRNFYRLHSIVGSMAGNDEAYNSAIRPDMAAIKIISEEATLTKAIQRTELRIRKFDEFLIDIDRSELEQAVELEEVTPLEQEAYEFINEIEYYLMNHAIERLKKRNDKLMSMNMASMQEEMKANNRLNLYGKVDIEQIKQKQALLSEVSSYEASLFEKLEELLA